MKVKELIKMLSEQDQESMIVISGYRRCGVEEFQCVNDVVVETDVNTPWWHGRHEIDCNVSNGDIIPETRARAVFLN